MKKTETKSRNIRQSSMKMAVVFSAVVFCTTGGYTSVKADSLKDVITKTAKYETETVTDPTVASIGGEWTVMPLARGNIDVPDNYFEKYRANVEKNLKENDGVLSDYKYTEYSRVILALKSIGADPSDIGGYDIQKPLEDFDTVTSQGLNGAVYALLALNADDPVGHKDQDLEKKYLNYILEQEKTDGGFALDTNSNQADIDMTSMTLQSLEPYQDQKEVKEAIDKGIEILAAGQEEDGGYVAYGSDSSESVSQVIIALSTYGIDCNEDERFVKNDKGLYDTLMEYQQKDGGFSHTLDGESDGMATDQAFCALVSYERMKNGENSFYNMTDQK